MSQSIRPSTDMAHRRVLLIGGAGFIGHHLALRLREHGADVTVQDSLQVNNLLTLHDSISAPPERDLYTLMLNERLRLMAEADIKLYVDDARDYHRMSRCFAAVQPDTVVLLAAVSHASRANKDPMNTLDHSFRTLENALDNSRGNVQHFIFFSSSMVYGNFVTDSVDEDAPCNPIGIYGAVKLGGEKLVAAYGSVFDLPFTNIRPSALYGERCISRRVGQIFIENALRGKELVIQGDGTDRIDFTYIDDLTQGVLQVMTKDAAKGQTFNMTYGSARTLNEVAELVSSEFPGTGIRHVSRSPSVPERGTLNISKARDLLGYQPKFSVTEGFARYVSWYRQIFRDIPFERWAHLDAQANE